MKSKFQILEWSILCFENFNLCVESLNITFSSLKVFLLFNFEMSLLVIIQFLSFKNVQLLKFKHFNLEVFKFFKRWNWFKFFRNIWHLFYIFILEFVQYLMFSLRKAKFWTLLIWNITYTTSILPLNNEFNSQRL